MPIHVENRRRAPRLPTPLIRWIGARILEALGEGASELSVVATDDDAVHALNREWRGKDKATDVLSFSQLEGEMGAFPGPRQLGDVVISMDTAARQAEAIGHALRDEFERLLIHGVLHLLGHDHVNGGLQARKMKGEEERILSILRARRPESPGT